MLRAGLEQLTDIFFENSPAGTGTDHDRWMEIVYLGKATRSWAHAHRPCDGRSGSSHSDGHGFERRDRYSHSRRCRCGRALRAKGLGALARVAHHEEIGEYRHDRAFLKKGGEQATTDGRSYFECSLIGLDFGHCVSRRYRVAGAFQPSADDTLFHRIAQFGNFHRNGH